MAKNLDASSGPGGQANSFACSSWQPSTGYGGGGGQCQAAKPNQETQQQSSNANTKPPTCLEPKNMGTPMQKEQRADQQGAEIKATHQVHQEQSLVSFELSAPQTEMISQVHSNPASTTSTTTVIDFQLGQDAAAPASSHVLTGPEWSPDASVREDECFVLRD